VTESSREWEQPLQHLRDLLIVHERTKGKTGDDCDAQSEFDAVDDLNVKDGTRPKAIRPQEVDEVGRSHVEVDVLETEQSRKDSATGQETGLLPCEDDR
jgi:hypothetical protein